MARKKKPVQWYTVAHCKSGEPHIIYFASLPAHGVSVALATLPLERVCPTCRNRSIYGPEDFFRTQKAPS